MPTTQLPAQYEVLNSQQTKELSVVVRIEGLEDTLSLGPIYERLTYGMPGVTYGSGYVYGQLVPVANNRPYLDVGGGLTISQKIEPESGKGAIATLSLTFIDYGGYMSQLCAVDGLLDEPLGGKLVHIYLGYRQSSFPQDYIRVFRGYITDTTSSAGTVTLQLSDANVKRKGEVFFGGKTKTTASISDTDLIVPVVTSAGFFDHIEGPDGTFDDSVRTYLKIGSEWMEYGPGDLAPTAITVQRGGAYSLGTTPEAHDINADVTNTVQLTGNVIDLALKVMLSGYNGPWKSGVVPFRLGTTMQASRPGANAIILSRETFSSDALADFGLTAGDQVTISGSTAGNNGSYLITSVEDLGDRSNQRLMLDADLAFEDGTSGVTLAFRSKYDTLPITCGCRNTPQEVDVLTHEEIRDSYLSTVEMDFIQSAATKGKDWIESQIYKALGLYSLTRYGTLSVAITKPPLPTDRVIILDKDNIKSPERIQVKRAVNNRRFYNSVTIDYDRDPAGVYGKRLNLIDSESLSKTTIASGLTIQSDGLKSEQVATARAKALLNRYKKAAFELKLDVFWSAGSLTEVGDVVLVRDQGGLKITNFETGERDIGIQAMEVINREYRIKDGYVSLTLLSNLGFRVEDRRGTISPSSEVATGSTTGVVRIRTGYGVLYGEDEWKKWERFTGLPIRIHSLDWTRNEETTLVSLDRGDPFRLNVSPALSFVPQAGDVVEIGDYGTSEDPSENEFYKVQFAYVSPTLTVVSGSDQKTFTMGAGDIAELTEGTPIVLRNANYAPLTTGSVFSNEIKIESIVGTTVTLESDLGFVPAAGQKVELVSFKDGGGAYRFL